VNERPRRVSGRLDPARFAPAVVSFGETPHHHRRGRRLAAWPGPWQEACPNGSVKEGAKRSRAGRSGISRDAARAAPARNPSTPAWGRWSRSEVESDGGSHAIGLITNFVAGLQRAAVLPIGGVENQRSLIEPAWFVMFAEGGGRREARLLQRRVSVPRRWTPVRWTRFFLSRLPAVGTR